MNIKFNYLYRDAANYKQFGDVVFSNPEGLGVEEIESRIRAALIDGEFFDPIKWGVPRLQFDDWDDEVDHMWNEFEGVEEMEEEVSMGETVKTFIIRLPKMQRH